MKTDAVDRATVSCLFRNLWPNLHLRSYCLLSI
uniref:Uncharacterized protein n=1 Tax=Arundo donax TaxID=35708 RepID=A0A0A9CAJ5_ARUDO